CDMPAARDADLDVEALRRTPVQIVPAVGTSTPVQVFDYQCAVQLGTALSVPVHRLPGGHKGSITHPHGYGEEIRRLLNGDAHQSCGEAGPRTPGTPQPRNGARPRPRPSPVWRR